MHTVLRKVRKVFKRNVALQGTAELRGTSEQEAQVWASLTTVANFLDKDVAELSEEEYRGGQARLAFVDEALDAWQADDDESTLEECAVEAGARHGFSPEVSTHIVVGFIEEHLGELVKCREQQLRELARRLEHEVD